MTLPQWTLLGFAVWMLLLLALTVGVYRWGMILFRGTRAHANCVENLPVFGVIVSIISTIGLSGWWIDTLCVLVLAARVCQSVVHLSHKQTDAFVAVRHG